MIPRRQFNDSVAVVAGNGPLQAAYTNPFQCKKHVEELALSYKEKDARRRYPDDAAFAAGASLRGGRDIRENLQTIYRWKLETFLKRNFSWVVEFPNGISNVQLESAVHISLRANNDPASISGALKVLDDLPFVGLPVASAFLTALFPCQFTVIDRQAYKALHRDFPNRLSVQEYLRYLGFCKHQSRSLDVSLRDYDRALWQYGGKLRPSIRNCFS